MPKPLTGRSKSREGGKGPTCLLTSSIPVLPPKRGSRQRAAGLSSHAFIRYGGLDSCGPQTLERMKAPKTGTHMQLQPRDPERPGVDCGTHTSR